MPVGWLLVCLCLGAACADYPEYGHWPDAYYISTREFTGGTTFAGVGAYALNRTQMIAGNSTPQVISFLATPGVTPYRIGDGLLPADLDGSTLPPAGTPNFYIGSQDNGGPYGAPSDALNLWEFHVDFVTPANSTFTGPLGGLYEWLLSGFTVIGTGSPGGAGTDW